MCALCPRALPPPGHLCIAPADSPSGLHPLCFPGKPGWRVPNHPLASPRPARPDRTPTAIRFFLPLANQVCAASRDITRPCNLFSTGTNVARPPPWHSGHRYCSARGCAPHSAPIHTSASPPTHLLKHSTAAPHGEWSLLFKTTAAGAPFVGLSAASVVSQKCSAILHCFVPPSSLRTASVRLPASNTHTLARILAHILAHIPACQIKTTVPSQLSLRDIFSPAPTSHPNQTPPTSLPFSKRLTATPRPHTSHFGTL